MAGGLGFGSRRSSSRSRRKQGIDGGPRDLLSLGISSDDEDPCAEAAALGVNTAVSNNVLAGLRRQPPPRSEDAQADAAELVARWESAPSSVVTRGGPGSRKLGSRSLSRGPSEAVRAAAVLATNADRPPRPLQSRGPSPTPPVASSPGVGNVLRAPSPPVLPASPATPSSSSGPGRRLPGAGTEDTSLLSSMAARLAQVEKLNQQLSSKLAKQTQEVETLRAAKAAAGQGSGEAGAEASATQRRKGPCMECAELRRQVEDMKQFLADYGLTWVPRTQDSVSTIPPAADLGSAAMPPRQCVDRKSAADVATASSVSVDINVLRARVEAMNAAVEEEAPAVAKMGGVAQIAGSQSVQPLPLTFFADGVKLADHAFMPYGAKPAQELIKSILDGATPAPLRESHPNGVPLRVVDRTGNGFAAWFREFSRNDPELADGGERLRPSCGRAARDPADSKSSGQRLVDKLPERVVLKNGRVCEVRGAIAERLGVPAKPTATGAPPAALPMGKDGEVSLLEKGRDAEAPTARLMVKLEGGQRVKLCMEPHATVGEVWAALERWRASNGVARAGADGRQCVLRQAFPPRAFTNMSETLEAAELVPSAALFVAAGEAAPA